MPVDDYLTCVSKALTKKGFKHINMMQLTSEYVRYQNLALREGASDAASHGIAAEKLQRAMEGKKWARVKATEKNLKVFAEGEIRLTKAMGEKTIKGSLGYKISRGFASMFTDEKRVNGMNAFRLHENFRGRYRNIMSDPMQKYSLHKGFMGRQLGKAHLDNIVDEAFGTTTHDQGAKEFVKAFEQMQDVGIADTNTYGGSIRKLLNWGLPNPSHPTTMVALIKKAGIKGNQIVRAAWVESHQRWIDWTKTLWADGTEIAEADREAVLKYAFDSISTGGMAHADPQLGVQGRAIGNLLDSNRFLFYKGPAEWRAAHAEYGKGTSVFDVVMNHVDKVAWRNSVLKMLGPNPNAMAQTLERMAIAKAAKIGGAVESDAAKTYIEGSVKPIVRHVLRQDVQNPNTISRATSTISNVLYGSLLGSTTIISVLTDPIIAITNRLSQSEGIKGLISGYMGAMFPGGKTKALQDMLRVGFLVDEYTSDNAAGARYILGHGYGEAMSKTFANFVFATSGLNRHTAAIRAGDVRAMLFHLRDQMDKPLSEVPSRGIFEQYGISASDWDTIRKGAKTVSPRNGVELFDPISILDIKHANKDDLYYKIQSMVQGENASSVIMGSPEARAKWGSGKPTTLIGAGLQSVAMLKMFPTDLIMRFSRIAMTMSGTRRTAMLGGMIVGLTLAGGISKQLNNLSRGKNPEDMTTGRFWLGALISGGGLGIYGQFINEGLSNDPRGSLLQDFAGPMVGALADALTIAGVPAKWALVGDVTTDEKWSSSTRKIADWFERYATPKPWWARLVIEREMWDRIDEMLDPVGTQKARQLAVNRWQSQHGSSYYWPPAGASQ